jgi:hypothetical protein
VRIETLARACAIAAALAFAACGADKEPPAAATSAPTPAPTEAPTTTDPAATPPPSGGGASPAINSVTVDPGDGTIMVGSGPALYRLGPGAKEAETLRLDVARKTSGCLLFEARGSERPERFQLALEIVPTEAGGIWNLAG